jgi:hypothetical protein
MKGMEGMYQKTKNSSRSNHNSGGQGQQNGEDQAETKARARISISFVGPYLTYDKFSYPPTRETDIGHDPVKQDPDQREQRRIWKAKFTAEEYLAPQSDDADDDARENSRTAHDKIERNPP